jgi:hypothetical protein
MKEIDLNFYFNKKYYGWKYIVWVGGVDDYYTNYLDAKKAYDEWIEQGYDNVILEKIEEK